MGIKHFNQEVGRGPCLPSLVMSAFTDRNGELGPGKIQVGCGGPWQILKMLIPGTVPKWTFKLSIFQYSNIFIQASNSLFLSWGRFSSAGWALFLALCKGARCCLPLDFAQLWMWSLVLTSALGGGAGWQLRRNGFKYPWLCCPLPAALLWPWIVP